MQVFLLWHTHRLASGEDDAKLIGVYSTETEAEAARERVGSQPGFRGAPEGFEVCPYTVDRDHWTEGFATVFHG